MKNKTTFLKTFFTASILLLAGIVTSVKAQVNVASAALGTIATQSGGGSGAYGPEKYINDTLLEIGSTMPFADQGYVTGGGWIEFTFSAPATVNKIVFFKEARPVTKAIIEAYDATTSSYVQVAVYENYINNNEDSLSFAAVTTEKIRLSNITGHANNPNFREIKIMSAPPGACTGTPTVSAAQARYVPGTMTPVTNLQNNFATTVNVCPGGEVYLSAYNLPFATGLSYQWNRGGAPIAGATNRTYVFNAFLTASYTVTVTCGTNTVTSNAVNVTVSPISWQAIPYVQNFDAAWINSSCVPTGSSADLPGTGWANNPNSGNSSWRRSDQGTGSPAINEGAWTTVTGGNYNTPVTPASNLGPGWPTTGTSARFHSSTSLIYNDGHLDLFLNCSGQTGDKALYFYHMNKASALNDSLTVYLSTDGGNNFTRMAGWDTAISWRRRWIPIASNSANTIVRFTAKKMGNENTDIGIDSVYVVGPCSGTPAAGTIAMAAVTSACAGSSFTLTTNGTTVAGNLVYQWEMSADGGTTWSPVGNNCGSGGDGLVFTTPSLYQTTSYRMGVKCGAAGTFVYTNPIAFNVDPPQYAAIPFSENFNSTWTVLGTGCGTRSVPSVYFSNSPATNGSNNSWRRSDDGGAGAGNWTNPNNGVYSPAGITGLTGDFSARFHSVATPINMNGKLDLLLDCSSMTGDKEVHFGYINTSGTDSLQLFYSDDAGCNFTHVNTYYNTTGWEVKVATVPSNSARTIIRFQGHGEGSVLSDIGIDSVKVIPPCTGVPDAGEIVTGLAPCAGVNFTLNLSGFSQAAGLTYEWYKAIGNNPYTQISGATNTYYTDNILVPTYYYAVVTCNNSTLKDTTPVFLMDVAPFYHCYCFSNATNTAGPDVGNVRIITLPGSVPKLNNGNASPLNNNPNANKTYTDFRATIPPVVMYHDSTYAIFVTQINSGTFNASTVTVWIDTNRNGIFDPGEKFLHRYTSATTIPEQRVQDTFVMQVAAKVGITGMRVIVEQGLNANPVPCGTYNNGETEDYLVEIRYPPCNGPAYPGTTSISDTSGCAGYNIQVMNTTHENHRSDVSWVWQYSPDGFSWADVPGSQGRDTLNHVVSGPISFRMRLICYQSLDTTYSDTVKLTLNPPMSCYCYSQATGGALGDSTDIGAFFLNATTNPVAINVGGPHVMNSEAYRARTDYTRIPTPELWVDSTYEFIVYHITKSPVPANAKVTLFIDYNANMQYDIPQERVWTAYTGVGVGAFTATTNITIPPNVITNVPTGMRVIINNNTDPNVPSDEACGTYQSGETEDYVVIFRSPVTYVNTHKNIQWMNIFPNPTNGKFTVDLSMQKSVNELNIKVTHMTGQLVSAQQYRDVSSQFSRELDLSALPRGVYIVEVTADNERQIGKVILK